jgi:hypothetical protein
MADKTWRVKYECDTYPDGDGGSSFGEWWEVTDGTRKFRAEYQDDASALADALNGAKDGARYRWHKARNPAALLATAWGASKAACVIGDDPDAATDAAMAEAPAVGAA